jgi:protein-tyrosine phosphatase
MIDLHCHILPNVDDGPESLDESLRMAALAARDGVRAVVATPHTFNGLYTNTAFLLELPSHVIPRAVKDEIFAMTLRGVTPVITHPERNTAFQHDPGLLAEFISLGALSQVTAMSVEGAFGEFIGHVCSTLLRHRLVHVIASDAHSAGDRPPLLSRAVDRVGKILKSYDEAEAMVTSVPEAILDGRPVDVPEPVRLKRSAVYRTV